MSLHLLDIYSPFTSSEVDAALFISGFASVEEVDREGEIVSPLEFDLQTFMNCPQLLLNHKYIRHSDGSDGAIGTVERAVPSFISGSNPANPKEWIVKSLLDNQVVAFWPKMKSPKLKDGARGLFVVAKVTHKPTIKRIDAGELGGFSWVGYSWHEKDGRGVTRLKGVDLVEISVVNGPCMSQSTLRITDENDPLLQREVNLEDLSIYKMGFSKSKYNLEDVKRYTKALNIQTQVSENDDSYVISVGDESLVNANESVSIKIDNRFLVAAPKKAKNLSTGESTGQFQEGQMVYADQNGVEYVGRIEHIMYEGSLGEGTDFELPASPENPVLLVRVYSQHEDGWHQTQYMVGVMAVDAVVLQEQTQSRESSLVDKGYKKDDPEYRKKRAIALLGKLNSAVIKEKIMENGIQGTEVVEKNVEPVNLYVLDIDSFMSRYPKASVMKQKSVVIDEVPVEIHSLEVPVEEFEVEEVAETEVVEEVAAEEVATEVVAEVVTEEVVEEVAQVADDKYEKLLAAVANLLQRTEETIEKQEQFEQKLEAVKSVEDIREEVKQEFQKALKDNQDQKMKIEKQLAAFNRVVPDQDVRAEKVQSAKSETSTEINIFDYFGVVKERN